MQILKICFQHFIKTLIKVVKRNSPTSRHVRKVFVEPCFEGMIQCRIIKLLFFVGR